jgi:hypothetical protein
VNTPIGPRPILGLSSGGFNIIGSWPSGMLWAGLGLTAPYNAAGTSAGTPVGSSVTGVLWANGLGPPVGTVSTINPTPLWSATFTHPAGNVIMNVVPVGTHSVWAGNPGEPAIEVFGSQITGAQWISMQPPAPAGVTVFFVAALVAARRRSARPAA